MKKIYSIIKDSVLPKYKNEDKKTKSEAKRARVLKSKKGGKKMAYEGCQNSKSGSAPEDTDDAPLNFDDI